MAEIPRPHGYANWQEWAERLALSLDDTSGSGSVAPTLGTTPSGGGTGPSLPANSGSYILTGRAATLAHLTDLPVQGISITTFHSIGLYWEPTGSNIPLTDLDVPIRYRKTSDATWRRGLDIWYDRRTPNHYVNIDNSNPYRARGSIVHCDPNTSYIVQFGKYNNASDLTDITWVAQLTATTWDEDFSAREGVVTTLPETVTSQYNITTSGSPTAYRVYEAHANGTTITVSNSTSVSPIRISASYVIVRGITCLGGGNGIRIDAGNHDIIIEDCDISDWGVAMSGWPVMDVLGTIRSVNWLAGVSVLGTSNQTLRNAQRRIIIQRCSIHDPRYGSNSWDLNPVSGQVVNGNEHPAGSNAIDLAEGAGNNVIRYNSIFSSNNNLGKFFKDGIGNSGDFGQQGFPGNDSDIYMNRIHNCMDDGIQAEGGNANVRIWKNYTDRTGVAFASTTVELGPIYFWRNVSNRIRFHWGHDPDVDERPPIHKAYTVPTGDGGALDGFWGDGRRYVIHNTCLNWPAGTEGSVTRGLGANVAVEGASNQLSTNNRIWNNCWQLWRTGTGSTYVSIDTTTNITKRTLGSNNIQSRASASFETGSVANTNVTWKVDHGHVAEHAGRYQIASGAAGHDAGRTLFNFNDNVPAPHQYLGAAPDMGAHEEGSADMVFGPSASGS